MEVNSVTDQALELRDPAIVMDPYRIGAMHQTRISFVRSLLRKMSDEKWQIAIKTWAIEESGFGTAIYTLTTPTQVYDLVVFSDAIKDEERNDRVIAEKWDVTFALVNGEVTEQELQLLRQNVPLQEAGRNSPKVLVLSRANKSVRVFEHIVDSLSQGDQPDVHAIANVGYILRTTAVYGNGKFGIADFETLETNVDFSLSFSAQMCAVYILRQFSLDWVHFLANARGGEKSARLSPQLQRYIGIGNATGLGMAPYLIRHPRVVDNWLHQRELALASVSMCVTDDDAKARVIKWLEKARTHLDQVVTIDEHQQGLNAQSVQELPHLIAIVQGCGSEDVWKVVIEKAHSYSLETQEVLIASLLEAYPDRVDVYSDSMNTDESVALTPGVSVADMLSLLESRYRWALDIDFQDANCQYWFWYRSVDKEEPRMGVRGTEPGEHHELPLDIGRQVSRFYTVLNQADNAGSLAQFLLKHPEYRLIARRVWTLGNCPMGDIQINVLDKHVLPMHLLRCKLAMFGATKFDPRSDRWVRVTLFQGAPLASDTSNGVATDDWLFPLLPVEEA
ncbi:hypothetical protein LRP49_03805 [Enterovibrio sp. ZSDZ35]|uniref:Uncharacterized protein n=1 Tax=Enterovibrio qingdaonensis TaxID=2899818 RepID=A0ABT5QHJ8_9GAMM|nr:hypothetical protein [Enterovibrio sp. ZSDZ35]MDD1780319.1 hypothetical protein [Enterovibrio sp. ZSDZ35]